MEDDVLVPASKTQVEQGVVSETDTLIRTELKGSQFCRSGVEIRIGAKAIIAGGGGFVQSIGLAKGHFGMDIDGQPILGLYIIGLDGAMLWANEYTLTLPAGTNGFNVYSGRTAATDAVETCLA